MIAKRIYTGAILALDTASGKTGYAVYRNGRIEISGTWSLKRKTRFADLFQKLTAAIKKYGITLIVAEDIYRDKDPRKVSAFEILAECRGVVECVAQSFGMEVSFISPVAVKQHIWNMRYKQVLSRQKQKEMMIRAICQLGYELEHDRAEDEADAIGILITYLEGGNYELSHPK